MSLSNKTACIIDNGLFVSFARKVAPAFRKCYYHVPFTRAYVRTQDISVGMGFPEIDLIRQPLAIADEVDIWIFFDLYNSGLQLFLAERGAKVFGARSGEELELERWAFKRYLKTIGLPVQPVVKVVGLDELRKFLRTVEDKYVKTSFTRGDFETFRHESYELTEPRLNELAHVLGPTAEEYEFIIEDVVEGVEIGYDGFCIDGMFPKHAMMAYEVKDVGMIGTVKPLAALAEPVKHVNASLVDTLCKHQYRGFFCTEIRYGKNRKPYLIDPCCRLGTPSNELLQELFTDWPEVLWNGAEGVVHDPKPIAKYGVLAVIHSEWAVGEWQSLRYPKELDDFVKLRFHYRSDDGVDYVVPQTVGMPDVGCVVGTGSSLEHAIRQCEERVEQVKGYQIEVSLEAIDKAQETIAEGEKLGIRF